MLIGHISHNHRFRNTKRTVKNVIAYLLGTYDEADKKEIATHVSEGNGKNSAVKMFIMFFFARPVAC